MGVKYLDFRTQSPPKPEPRKPEPWEIESQAEISVKAKIQQLMRKEHELRCRAGQMLLADKFITDKPFDQSPEYLAFQKIKTQSDELWAKDAEATKSGNDTQTYAYAARKLTNRLNELEAAAIRARRFYQLGNECFAIREQIKQAAEDRDRLQAERLATGNNTAAVR